MFWEPTSWTAPQSSTSSLTFPIPTAIRKPGGFTDTTDWHPLKVVGTDDPVLKQILEQDPRPHYHDDPDRIYGMQYNGKDIHFKVKDKTLFIIDE